LSLSYHPTIVINQQPKNIETGVSQFVWFLCSHTWNNVLLQNDVEKKFQNVHNNSRSKLDEYLPEKTVMVSSLDIKMDKPTVEKYAPENSKGIFQEA
jgi:hypothetical protein